MANIARKHAFILVKEISNPISQNGENGNKLFDNLQQD